MLNFWLGRLWRFWEGSDMNGIKIIWLVLLLLEAPILLAQKSKRHDDSTRVAQCFGDDFVVSRQGKDFVLNKKAPLTVGEFAWYQWYVRDSVVMENGFSNSFQNRWSNRQVLKYLDLNKKQKRSLLKRMKSDSKLAEMEVRREANLAVFNTKVKKKLFQSDDIASSKAIYSIALSNRFFFSLRYRMNDNLLFYKHIENGITSYYSIFSNHWILSEQSKHPFDLFNVIAKVYPVMMIEQPVIGVTENQLIGSAHHYSKYSTKCLQERGLNYRAIFDLKLVPDTLKFEVSKDTLIKHWCISKEDYQQFTKHVTDSALREFMYRNIQDDYEAERFIQYEDQYFDENALEWVEYDPSERELNRRYFDLNYFRRYDLKNPEIAKLYKTFWDSICRENPKFLYPTFDARKLIRRDVPQYNPNFKHSIKNSAIFQIDTLKISIPYAWDVDSLPFPGLTYAQALAFYNWKFPIRKVMSFTKSWTQYVFPSEEEYGYLQRGELDKIKDVRASIPIQAVRVRVVLKHF